MIIYSIIILISVIFYLYLRKKKALLLDNEHCLITGGSSGIGLAMAIQAAKAGANVTIIARSKERLESAKEQISLVTKNSNQVVLSFSEDISKDESNLRYIVEKAETQAGPITMLINCAGTSICHRFEDTSTQDFNNMLNVNFIGSVNMTKAVLPLMKSRKNGHIVFVSSLAGLIGLYGYTAYSGSKFAHVGLAECLQMEVRPYNIGVTVSFPPDTDTPGFAEEVKDKPIETIQISESGGLFSAEEVATKTLQDVMNNKFMSTVGFEGWMLCMLCSGATPVNSYLDLIIQVLTMGLFRIVLFVYMKQFEWTIQKCAEEKERKDKKN
ncbi:hypothetical protein JTE90_009487 [Oedothorax gibbosus]|uniref:3-dehydrosphinganine reductase n=1 Tax=Oedothorax gibbosus TaxID=931172 RepID=A0AAV6UVW0_9ARAC|nr:hypothetical protein JTE90_009487 [Oedothorax gibbosus]